MAKQVKNIAAQKSIDSGIDLVNTKPPVVRRGQVHEYRRGSHREMDARRGAVARLMASGCRKMEIHRYVRKHFDRQWRTADRDIAFVLGIGKWLSRTRRGYRHIKCDQTVEELVNAVFTSKP